MEDETLCRSGRAVQVTVWLMIILLTVCLDLDELVGDAIGRRSRNQPPLS